jgi:hypothetical protein
MNENMPQQNHETTKKEEAELRLPEGHHEQLLEAGELKVENQRQQVKVEQARDDISETAKSSSETEFVEPLEEQAEATSNSAAYIRDELKNVARDRELTNLRRQLKPYQKVLSKIVHQPAVSKASEVGSKTVSRPSGLLGGGIVALVGSLGYYLLAKHIGFTYNYVVFFMLFVAGFFIGLTLELIIYSFSKKRHIN